MNIATLLYNKSHGINSMHKAEGKNSFRKFLRWMVIFQSISFQERSYLFRRSLKKPSTSCMYIYTCICELYIYIYIYHGYTQLTYSRYPIQWNRLRNANWKSQRMMMRNFRDSTLIFLSQGSTTWQYL